MKPGRIVVTRRLPESAHQLLDQSGHEIVVLGDAPSPRSRVLDAVVGASAAITLLTDRVDHEFLEAATPSLSIVANVAVGYDNVDLVAAAERDVIVSNTPGVLDEATADLTLALILATTRRVVEADAFIRTGADWIWGPREWIGLDVSAGATLGIVGLGRIGMAVARRATAFGMNVIASGRRADSDEARAVGIIASSVDEVFTEADIVSLHCPLTPQTRGLVDEQRLATMRHGSYLINTARGPLVDEDALSDALESGRLAGAGLDVHAEEPAVNERLRAHAMTVLLPHIGSAGDRTRDEMAMLAVRNVLAVCAGEAPLTPVADRTAGSS